MCINDFRTYINTDTTFSAISHQQRPNTASVNVSIYGPVSSPNGGVSFPRGHHSPSTFEVDEEVSDTTLSDILKAAGVKVVTDADLNQAEAQPVEEEDTEEAMIQPEMEEACEECSETPCVCSVEEEAVSEEPEMVSIDANTLQQILNLAGVKPVTDADINQPEPVEEYSNSPDEEYADTDTQLNKMSGGPNRPKVMPAVGNDGHNKLVMKLKKAYSDIE